MIPKVPRWLEWIVLITIPITLIVTAIGVFKSEKQGITVEIVRSNELTSVQNVPNLEVQYYYKEQRVDHLWDVSIRIINTGNKTVIGKGLQKTIINDAIFLDFTEGSTILKMDILENDPLISIASVNDNKVKLSFDQWREDEDVLIDLYLRTSIDTLESMLPHISRRDLINGEVKILDVRSEVTARSMIEQFPAVIRSTIKVLAIIWGFISVIVIAAFPFGVISSVISAIRLRSWKQKNMEKFTIFIDANNQIDASRKEEILARPYQLDSELWVEFEGDKIKLGDMAMESLEEGAKLFGFFLLAIIILLMLDHIITTL